MKFFRSSWFWRTLIGLIVLVVLSLIWGAYRFNWPGTGFQGKTVWDWLQLLIIPLALALVALLFQQVNTHSERLIAQQRYEQERQIALDKQREDLLQAYLDRMSELLLKENLRTSQPDAEVRNVARTRTISVLRQLDTRRVEDVFTFLREAGLMDKTEPIVSLKDADLSGVKWPKVKLHGADLRGANLRGADLNAANLREANLSEVGLWNANLEAAHLDKANLQGTNLSWTNLRWTSLKQADLRGARLDNTNLSYAHLHQADFRGASLESVNLSNAKFCKTDLRGANLTKASIFPREAQIDKGMLTPEQIAGAILEDPESSSEQKEEL